MTDLSAFAIERWTVGSRFAVAGCVMVFALLALAPAFLGPGYVDRMTVLFIYAIVAAMWNALAGYGQQLFFGLGAYSSIRLADFGIDPFASLFFGTLFTGAVSYPISLVTLRLKAGEFAIGMWVLAEIAHLFVNFDTLVRGETGTSLISLNTYLRVKRTPCDHLLAGAGHHESTPFRAFFPASQSDGLRYLLPSASIRPAPSV
jgi:branched-chain amino acid transport system permease protein